MHRLKASSTAAVKGAISFGKGKRWMVAPTAEWQQIVLKVDSVTGKSLFTVDGKPKESMEPLEDDVVKNLPDQVYLRALGKAIEFQSRCPVEGNDRRRIGQVSGLGPCMPDFDGCILIEPDDRFGDLHEPIS